MSLYLRRIRIKNFLSTGNVIQEIQLDCSMLTLILGMIEDADDEIKNGAGKTTILQAISYALFGKPVTRIKIPNLVNNVNKKAMLVSLDMEDDRTKYTIERGQKPATFRFFVNDKEVKQEAAKNDALGENRFTQAEINRIIGMSHALFRYILGLNTFTDPFLKLGEAAQREIVEELFGITQISNRAEKLRALSIETKDRIREQEAHIKATSDANGRIEKTLQSLEFTERNWTRTQQAEIARLEEAITTIGQIDFEGALAAFDAVDAFDTLKAASEASVAPLRGRYDEAKRAVQSLTNEDERLSSSIAAFGSSLAAKHAATDIERKRSDILRHQASIESFKIKVEEKRGKHDHQVCISCGQEITDADKLAGMIATIEAEIVALEKAIVREETMIRDRHNDIVEIEAALEQSERHRDEQIAQARSHKTIVEDELTKQKDAMVAHKAALDALQTEDLGERPVSIFATRDELYEMRSASDRLNHDLLNEKRKTNPYVDQIATIRSTLQKIDYSLLNDLSTDLKHQDFLLKLLTSKDSFIRKKIVEQNLPYLNERMSHYLRALALPHHVVFQSDLSVEIVYKGNDYDFEALSRGEMNRVIMATNFAFRDIWESLNQSINLLWVDELLDQGTCDPGVESALKILQEMGLRRGKNVYLVSHKEDLLRPRIKDVLCCRKAQDFTTFEAGAAL